MKITVIFANKCGDIVERSGYFCISLQIGHQQPNTNLIMLNLKYRSIFSQLYNKRSRKGGKQLLSNKDRRRDRKLG